MDEHRKSGAINFTATISPTSVPNNSQNEAQPAYIKISLVKE